MIYESIFPSFLLLICGTEKQLHSPKINIVNSREQYLSKVLTELIYCDIYFSVLWVIIIIVVLTNKVQYLFHSARVNWSNIQFHSNN